MRTQAITVTLDPDRPASPHRVNVPGAVAVDGRRFRRWFPTRAAADRFAAEQQRAAKNHTDRALAFTEAQKEEAARCIARVAEHGRTLTDAVALAVDRWTTDAASVSLATLREHVLAAKTQDGRTRAHLASLGRCLERFQEAFPDRSAASITTPEVDGYLRGLKIGPVSRDSYRTLIGVAFEFAVRRGWAKSNPVKHVDRAGGVGREAVILTPEQMAELFRVADPRLVPWLALGGFAGLRPTEAARCTWGDIGAERIRLSAAKTKTRATRNIPILPALRAWLPPDGPDRASHHRLCPPPMTLRRLLRKAWADAGFAKWPQDGLRKSWISYRLALTNDENTTAAEAGNSPGIIVKFYRSLTDSPTAERWFSLRPNGIELSDGHRPAGDSQTT